MSPATKPKLDWNIYGIGKGDDYPRFLLLAGLLNEHAKGSLLDIGCDHGRLRWLIPEFEYTGLDINEQALIACRADFPGDEFHDCDAEEWETDQKFDCIVFNECLYYFNPEQVLEKYLACLNPGGILAISIYKGCGFHARNRPAIKAALRFTQKHCHPVCQTEIKVGQRSWELILTKKPIA